MQREHIPITAFLIRRAAQENVGYWRAFERAGGVIEDHTISHPVLTTLPFVQQLEQWAQPRSVYASLFGSTPVLGRPPYGAYDASVLQAARQAGLSDVVLWSATMSNGVLETYNHGPLGPARSYSSIGTRVCTTRW
jgi:peptidoglycan/xylan/chitin deacetylase (PgdA/CDA1 family)